MTTGDLHSGERQVGASLEDIRADHVARYAWAASRIGAGHVIDAGCGVGYGAAMLAESGACYVTAIDRSADALAYGLATWARPNIGWQCADLSDAAVCPTNGWPAAAVVAFEVIEHLADPLPFLIGARWAAKRLYSSVPNADVMPLRPGRFPFHYRHYTAAEFSALLAAAGWEVAAWGRQAGPTAPVERCVRSDAAAGATIVVEAVRA